MYDDVIIYLLDKRKSVHTRQRSGDYITYNAGWLDASLFQSDF